jgi:hypothetical protein
MPAKIIERRYIYAQTASTKQGLIRKKEFRSTLYRGYIICGEFATSESDWFESLPLSRVPVASAR